MVVVRHHLVKTKSRAVVTETVELFWVFWSKDASKGSWLWSRKRILSRHVLQQRVPLTEGFAQQPPGMDLILEKNNVLCKF